MKGFKPITKLGEGAFGIVYKVLRLEDSKEYALKQIKIKKLSQKQKNGALNEIRILASINHPNVIGYRDAFLSEDGQTLNIVMDFASKGDLNQKIEAHRKNKSHFLQSEIWKMLIHTCRGLACLHSKSIVHRDLKGANIFINEQGQYLLGDLNIAKVIVCGMAETQIGTPYYASPQVWQDIPYDQKSDIWSLGCILYQMAALEPPFKGKDMGALARKVKSGIYSRIPDFYSKDLTTIIGYLLKVSPHLRLSSHQVLQHSLVKKNCPFISSIDDIKSQGMMLSTITFNEQNPQLVQLPKSNYDSAQKHFIARKRISTLQNQSNYYQENRQTQRERVEYNQQKSEIKQGRYQGGDYTDRNDKYKREVNKIRQSRNQHNILKMPPRPNVSNRVQRIDRSPVMIQSPRSKQLRQLRKEDENELLYRQYLASRDRQRKSSYQSNGRKRYIVERKSAIRNY